jgi:hypothetical protein
MLTIVCAASETNNTWPVLFFGSESVELFEDFINFVCMPNPGNWHSRFREREAIRKNEQENYIHQVAKECYIFPNFWWRAFQNEDRVCNNVDNESDLTRQELIDMCNFNIKSGHVFKCMFAAKTYLWLCNNRSKISSITFN